MNKSTLAKMHLSKIQLGIFFESIANPDSTVYNCSFIEPFDKATDIARLKKAIEAVISAHPGLKTRITYNSAGEPVFDFTSDIEVRVISLSEDEFNARKSSLVRTFNLINNPLARFEIYITSKSNYLFADIHHVVADGASILVMSEDVTKAYAGEEIPAESYSPVDLVLEEDALYESEQQTAGKYYDALLSDIDTGLLPIRDAYGEIPQSDIYETKFSIDEATFKTLRHFLKISTTALFTAVMGFVTAKFTGADESLITTVYNGRDCEKKNNLVSMLVRTMPHVVKPGNDKTVAQILRESMDELSETKKFSAYSFVDIARDYGVTSDIGFSYQGRLDCFDFVQDGFAPAVRIFDDKQLEISKIVLEIYEHGAGTYKLHIRWRTDFYTRSFIESFARAYIKTVHEFLIKEQVCDIETADEPTLDILDRFNQTEYAYDRTKTLIDLFSEQVKQKPDAPAVICNDTTLTYAELGDLSERLASYIHAKGIGTDEFVSILVPRNEFMAVTSLGVTKAGAAYQPLDATYPPDRLNFMVKDSGARLLIADRQLRPLLADYTGDVLYTDEIAALPAAEDLSALRPKPEDAIIILYTSGTTGTPKGCILEHKNIAGYHQTYKQMMHLTPASRVASYASFGFDAGLMDIFTTFAAGASLYILDDALRLDLPALDKYFIKCGITNVFMTTQVGRMFAGLTKCRSLKNMLVGGEKLVPFVPPQSIRFLNGYGPSEATCCITCEQVTDEASCRTIGKSHSNTRLYVVDKNMHRLPVGAAGELCAAGVQVGRGYLNRPDKTAEVFVKNPFSDEEEYAKLYRTGDVVRMLSDGRVEYIGRTDGQVKIRGFRVELTEVEQVIREFAGIKDATVAAFDDEAGGKFIAAYVVSADFGAEIDTEALSAFIAERKPAYMVPASIMQIAEIPLTVNAKVDKKKLPKPVICAGELISPETEIQKRIFTHAAELLGTESFGITTDLFMAGITSISVLKFAIILEKEFGLPFQTKDIKNHPTVKQLEEFILQESDNAAKTIAGFETLESYPLTKTQEGIFVECLRYPDSTLYNIPVLLKIDSAVDEQMLKSALVKTVNAHPYMKTRLFIDESGSVCHRRCDDDASFDENAIETCYADTIETIISDRTQPLVKPFTLLEERLFRVRIIHADGLYLFFDVHHIIADGTSITLFLDDLCKIYKGETVLPEKYSGYELVLNERSERADDALTQAKTYYDNLLSGNDTTELLPSKFTDPKKDVPKQMQSKVKTVSFDGAKTASTFCEENKLSMNGFFTGVFGLVLAKFANTDTAVFAGIYNGRNDSRFANSFAMMVKTLPIVCNCSGCGEIVPYLKETSSRLLETQANDIYSFAEINRDFGITSDILFVYQGDNFTLDTLCGFPAQLISLPTVIKVPLSFQVSLQDNRITCLYEYDGAQYEQGFIESFLSAYKTCVFECMQKKSINEVVLTDTQMIEKLDCFNQTESAYDRTKTLIDLFSEQVKQQPDAPAVICNDTTLTYAELGDLSERLASYIHAKGIGTDEFVSILVPRNEFMAITSLGVTKAGVAYQPLDATYPPDRLNFMVKDSGARLLIADRQLRQLLSDYDGDVLYTDEITDLPEAPADLSALRPKPEDAIIILYTSGTTGTPKGCILEHKNITGYHQTYRKMMHLTPASRVASYASFGFDAGLMDIFTTFAAGASLYILDDALRLDLPALDKYFIKCGITNVFMTTQVGRMFAGMTQCQSLKNMLVGGEKLVPFVPPQSIRFLNGYGPSEATCCITCEQVTDENACRTIGKPHDNVKLYVVDKNMHRLPIGAAGELCAAGVQIGRGYLNRPDKTAEVFVQNPFTSNAEYAKLYRTGDVVRMLSDGRVEFIGRTDGQVKIRGFRVELTEVEQVIREFAGIKDATVAAFDDEAGGKFIAAYVVSADSGADIDTEALSAFIAERKPAYMVPASIMQIAEIPLTVNAKVDRRKLPKPELQTKHVGTPAANPLEEKLCGIFAKVLGIDTVYADDDFFALGGTSISASKVAMLCYNEGLNIVYKNIFDNHTPQSLASFAAAASKESVPVTESDKELPPVSEYADVLSSNTIPHLNAIQKNRTGVVLLTGATGFLGIHVLKELLDSGCEKIICLVHKAKNQKASDRLRIFLMYYFGGMIDEQMFERITVVEGDITDEELASALASHTFDTIINCAASVKHFASDDSIEKINYTGVKNLIQIAFEHNAQLIQTSTLSVCGSSVAASDGISQVLYENTLDIGQELNNKYIHSKYMAEQAVFDAIRKGLKAKVMRLGNLMSRNFDGEFQMNSATNNFMRTMRAYKKLGVFPVTQLATPVEFSPIDVVAKAIVLLSTTPSQFTVFHVNNCHQVHMANIIEEFNELGMPIEVVSEEKFAGRFSETMGDETANVDISCLLSYVNNEGEKVLMNDNNNIYTVNALYRLGFSWPLTDMAYIRRMLKGLESLRYFN